MPAVRRSAARSSDPGRVKLWLDAHLSPALAPWIASQFQCEVWPVRDLGLREALDREIFERARDANAVLITKDGDFSQLIDRFGPPPHVIWLRCGNTSNAYLRRLLLTTLPDVLTLIGSGEPLVEISEPW